MNAFQAAFDREQALLRAARHLADLAYRANRRFRLWERPEDDPIRVALDKRLDERPRLIRAHALAAHELDVLWDAYSRSLPRVLMTAPIAPNDTDLGAYL